MLVDVGVCVVCLSLSWLSVASHFRRSGSRFIYPQILISSQTHVSLDDHPSIWGLRRYDNLASTLKRHDITHIALPVHIRVQLPASLPSCTDRWTSPTVMQQVMAIASLQPRPRSLDHHHGRETCPLIIITAPPLTHPALLPVSGYQQLAARRRALPANAHGTMPHK